LSTSGAVRAAKYPRPLCACKHSSTQTTTFMYGIHQLLRIECIPEAT
jgi:hypothetical protein